jgi:hypothetical protein
MTSPFLRWWNRRSDFYKGIRKRDHDMALDALGYKTVRLPSTVPTPSEAQRYAWREVLATIDGVLGRLPLSSLHPETRELLAQQLRAVREFADSPTFPSADAFRSARDVIETIHQSPVTVDTDWNIRRELGALIPMLGQLAGESQ